MSPKTDKRFEKETQLYQPRTSVLGLGKQHGKPCLSISIDKQVFKLRNAALPFMFHHQVLTVKTHSAGKNRETPPMWPLFRV